MRLAVQLFTLRDLMDQNVDETFDKVAQCGYKAVETAGLNGLSAHEYRSLLDKHGLTAVASHVGLEDVTKNLTSTVETAKTLGSKWLVVPWVGQEDYAEGWGAFGEKLGGIAKDVISQGLYFAYHNHDFEFKDDNGAPGYQRLWDAAPETVEAELDLFWANFAGYDPAQWLRDLAGRVPLAHFKDGKGPNHVPVGEGDLDWESIIPAARTAGVEWAIVELDTCPRDPIDCVRSSFEYLTKLGLTA